MNLLTKARLRRLHSQFAPIMVVPVLLTLTTGLLFQMAVLTDKADNFLWLLELHRGQFGQLNLENIYPFFNAFGLLILAITGISLWWQNHGHRQIK